jgi:hypothetical protein
MKTVYYAPRMENYQLPFDHPLLDEVAYIQPVPFLTYFKDSYSQHTYAACPAWKNSFKNSYVFFSQEDVEINYNKETGVVQDKSFNYCMFDEANELINEIVPFGNNRRQKEPSVYNGVAVGQLNQHLVFWPKDETVKNMWLEIQPIPDMIRTHNAELIGGEFPFSRWFRPSLFAFKFHAEKTIFKRGDPLGIIKFKNLDNYLEDINLVRADPSDTLIRRINSHTRLKNYLPGKSWSLIKDAPAKLCPFKRFWK